MKLLLSIKPEFAHRIFTGEKTFEFRKAIHQQRSISTVAVYASKPVGMIIGEFQIQEIFCLSPEDLWAKTQHGAGISRQYFFEYFADRDIAYALKVGWTHQFKEPVAPKSRIEDFTPPQSYMYVTDELRRVERETPQIQPLLPMFERERQLSF